MSLTGFYTEDEPYFGGFACFGLLIWVISAVSVASLVSVVWFFILSFSTDS